MGSGVGLRAVRRPSASPRTGRHAHASLGGGLSGSLRAVPLARLYTSLGDRDQAITWLERLYGARTGLVVYLKVQSHFDPLRGEPLSGAAQEGRIERVSVSRGGVPNASRVADQRARYVSNTPPPPQMKVYVPSVLHRNALEPECSPE